MGWLGVENLRETRYKEQTLHPSHIYYMNLLDPSFLNLGQILFTNTLLNNFAFLKNIRLRIRSFRESAGFAILTLPQHHLKRLQYKDGLQEF
jgi:hypothetical protein